MLVGDAEVTGRSKTAIRPTGSPSSAAAKTRSSKSYEWAIPCCQGILTSGSLQPGAYKSQIAPVSDARVIPVRSGNALAVTPPIAPWPSTGSLTPMPFRRL
jgi:hypothetical protein